MAAATSHTDLAFQPRSIDILIGNDFASHESLRPWPHAVRNAMRSLEEEPGAPTKKIIEYYP